MATLNETLKKNPYGDMIIPVIAAMQHKYATFEEKAAIAELLDDRLRYWGRSIEHERGLPQRGQRELINKKALFSMSGALAARRPPGRFTEVIATFKRKLDAMKMDQVNAWVHFNQVVDVYYANVDFISYFASTYRDGKNFSDVLEAMGGYVRPGANVDGIGISTVGQGSVIGAPAIHTITAGALGGLEVEPYFTMTTPNGEDFWQVVFWYTYDGANTQPAVLEPANTTNVYVQIDIVTGDNAGTIANKTEQAINGVAGTYGFGTVVRVETIVTVPNLVNGSVAAPVVNMPLPWTVILTDGVDGGDVDTTEVTQFDFNYIKTDNLNNKYFIIWVGKFILDVWVAEQFTVWYNVDGTGVQPNVPGTIAYHEVSILSTDSKKSIATKTASVLSGGLKLSIQQTDDLVFIAGPIDIGPLPDTDPGTVGKGINNADTDILADDGTVLASDIVSDAEFVATWNALKVPYDEDILDVVTPYLKAIDPSTILTSGAIGAGKCPCPYAQAFAEPTPEQAAAYQEYWACIQACKSPGVTPPNNEGVFITTAYETNVDKLGFNKPAGRTTFEGVKDRRQRQL